MRQAFASRARMRSMTFSRCFRDNGGGAAGVGDEVVVSRPRRPACSTWEA